MDCGWSLMSDMGCGESLPTNGLWGLLIWVMRSLPTNGLWRVLIRVVGRVVLAVHRLHCCLHSFTLYDTIPWRNCKHWFLRYRIPKQGRASVYLVLTWLCCMYYTDIKLLLSCKLPQTRTSTLTQLFSLIKSLSLSDSPGQYRTYDSNNTLWL